VSVTKDVILLHGIDAKLTMLVGNGLRCPGRPLREMPRRGANGSTRYLKPKSSRIEKYKNRVDRLTRLRNYI
jgi:hypothetical protein